MSTAYAYWWPSVTSAPPDRSPDNVRPSTSGDRIVSRGQSATEGRVQVFKQMNGVISLDTLNDPRYVLRQPIAVRIEWSDEMECFVAYEDAVGLWYGAGDSKEDAVSVLQEVMVDIYADLESNQGHLHPRMCRQLEQMRRVIAHAG